MDRKILIALALTVLATTNIVEAAKPSTAGNDDNKPVCAKVVGGNLIANDSKLDKCDGVIIRDIRIRDRYNYNYTGRSKKTYKSNK